MCVSLHTPFKKLASVLLGTLIGETLTATAAIASNPENIVIATNLYHTLLNLNKVVDVTIGTIDTFDTNAKRYRRTKRFLKKKIYRPINKFINAKKQK